MICVAGIEKMAKLIHSSIFRIHMHACISILIASFSFFLPFYLQVSHTITHLHCFGMVSIQSYQASNLNKKKKNQKDRKAELP